MPRTQIDRAVRWMLCSQSFSVTFGYLTAVGDESVVALFATCRSSTHVFATLCTVKGPNDAYVVAAFASWIWELGHARLFIQSDGESAILALVLAVRDKVIADGKAEQIVCQISPRGSHESNGAAERTVQQVRRMARVFVEHVREKTESVFPPSSPWWAWTLRHAAWTYNRFHVPADTRTTPYSKNAAPSVRSTCVTAWRTYFGQKARRASAEEPDAVCIRLLVGQGLSHGRTHCGDQSGCVSHSSGSKSDRGQELVR